MSTAQEVKATIKGEGYQVTIENVTAGSMDPISGGQSESVSSLSSYVVNTKIGKEFNRDNFKDASSVFLLYDAVYPGDRIISKGKTFLVLGTQNVEDKGEVVLYKAAVRKL